MENVETKDNYKVYIHTVPKEVSGYDYDKHYIGITKRDVKVRWRNGEGYIKNDHFYRAIQKYGWENIKHEILMEDLSEFDAKAIEMSLIKKYKSNDYKYGYNISSGGEGKNGVPTSKLHKEVTSKRMKELWADDEYRERQSEMSKKNWTDERKIAHSNHMKNLWKDEEYRKAHTGVNSPFYGKPNIPLYRGDNGNSKKVVCLNTGKIYDCIADAVDDTGACNSNIGSVCSNKRGSSGVDDNGMKLVWAYLCDYEKMTEDEIKERIKKVNTPKAGRMIVNITNMELFSKAKVAAEKYGVANPCSINEVCRDKKGKIKNCIWVYYEDYLKENNYTDEYARTLLTYYEEKVG